MDTDLKSILRLLSNHGGVLTGYVGQLLYAEIPALTPTRRATRRAFADLTYLSKRGYVQRTPKGKYPVLWHILPAGRQILALDGVKASNVGGG